MMIETATATEMQNNGKEVGRFIPKDATVSYLTDSLTGILQEDYDLDEAKEESLREKYGFVG